jgi:hypothetical protein
VAFNRAVYGAGVMGFGSACAVIAATWAEHVTAALVQVLDPSQHSHGALAEAGASTEVERSAVVVAAATVEREAVAAWGVPLVHTKAHATRANTATRTRKPLPGMSSRLVSLARTGPPEVSPTIPP